jgi:multiple sugar transport system permease protein
MPWITQISLKISSAICANPCGSAAALFVRIGEKIMKWAARLFMGFACALAVAPLVWYSVSSVKSAAELAQIPPSFLPTHATLKNYAELFLRRPFATYYLNSVVIASLASLICIGSASLVAYRLARARKRFRMGVSYALLVMAFFPPIVLLFPVYELVRFADLVNQPWGLIIPYAALNLPFAVWLLAGYMEQIPYELEEAAAIDGLTTFQTYRKIILPLAMPALTTAFLLVFIFSWNEFMFALTFMSRDSSRTVTVGVATLSGAFAYEIPWGLLAAGIVVSTAPLIVAVALFQKRIVAGLTAGGVKQ